MRITPRFRARDDSAGPNRRSWWIAGIAAAVGLAALGVGLGLRNHPAPETRIESRKAESSLGASAVATPSAGRVEIPNVVGSTLAEARVVLSAAGFVIHMLPGSDARDTATVTSQDPMPGTVAEASTVVTLTALVPSTPSKTKPVRHWVVVIDPGHQEHSDSSPEPVGPGSKQTKPAVTGGTTGVVTEIPEYEVVLQIATNLQRRLEDRGIRVVMTRTTNDVNLSNAQRAAIANKAKANLFVRVHADGSPERSRSGISTLYPGSTPWTKTTWQRSKRAAAAVQASTIKETGAVDRGIVARTDISGFNYATMPSLLIECGFMSNPVEDRLLASPHYQDKLAEGIAEGVLSYLSGSGR